MFNALRKGFGLSAKTMFRPAVTTEYPDVKRQVQPRFHGRHVLNRYPDGLEKCIGCELCAWACPADAIWVEGADNTPNARYSPGERFGSIYQINYLRCIFCGLCIEACPTRSLTMTHEYELSGERREDFIFEKDQLLAPLPEGAKPTPHTDDEVRARGLTYYPGQQSQDPFATKQRNRETAAHRAMIDPDLLQLSDVAYEHGHRDANIWTEYDESGFDDTASDDTGAQDTEEGS